MGTVIATSPRGDGVALGGAFSAWVSGSLLHHLPGMDMRAYFVFLTGDWRPNAINTNPVIAIGSWFDCRLVGGMNEVIFAGEQVHRPAS